jgi:hypothetical protein
MTERLAVTFRHGKSCWSGRDSPSQGTRRNRTGSSGRRPAVILRPLAATRSKRPARRAAQAPTSSVTVCDGRGIGSPIARWLGEIRHGGLACPDDVGGWPALGSGLGEQRPQPGRPVSGPAGVRRPAARVAAHHRAGLAAGPQQAFLQMERGHQPPYAAGNLTNVQKLGSLGELGRCWLAVSGRSSRVGSDGNGVLRSLSAAVVHPGWAERSGSGYAA